MFGLTDSLAGITGATASDESPIQGAIASILLNNTLRNRGTSAAAVGLKSVADAVGQISKAPLGKLVRGGEKVATPASAALRNYFGIDMSDDDVAKAGFLAGNGGMSSVR